MKGKKIRRKIGYVKKQDIDYKAGIHLVTVPLVDILRSYAESRAHAFKVIKFVVDTPTLEEYDRNRMIKAIVEFETGLIDRYDFDSNIDEIFGEED